MLLLVLASVSLIWVGYSLITGKGYYIWASAEGFDRNENPFGFWFPTIIILVCALGMLLLAFGFIR